MELRHNVLRKFAKQKENCIVENSSIKGLDLANDKDVSNNAFTVWSANLRFDWWRIYWS